MEENEKTVGAPPATGGTPPVSDGAYSSPAGLPYTISGSRPNTPPGKPERLLIPSDRRDTVLAAILAVLAILTVNAVLFGGCGLGFALGFLALTVCEGLYLRREVRRPSGYGLLCAAGTLIGCGVFVWHADGAVRFLTLCGMVFLSMTALVQTTGTGRHGSGSFRSVADAAYMWLGRPVTWFGDATRGLFHVQHGETVQRRRTGGVFLGILCAVPALLVLVPLLIRADAAFEGLMQNTVLGHLGETAVSVLLGAGLFFLLFARLFSLRHHLPQRVSAHPPRRSADPVGINTFLWIIGGVYMLYLVSQLAYFFSAFAGILPGEYTVAEYARRGFFEMCAICTVNLLLVVICYLLSRQQAGRILLSTRIPMLFILVFSMGLVATALSKMGLYIGSFGMTRLRVLTSVFMLMLAAVILCVAVRLFAPRFAYMRVVVTAVAVIGLALALADVDTVVARYNVRAYQDGRLEEIDIEQLGELSDGAVPYLLELCEDKDPEVSGQAQEICALRFKDFWVAADSGKAYVLRQGADLRRFCVDTHRAQQLLLERAAEWEKPEEAYSYPPRFRTTESALF